MRSRPIDLEALITRQADDPTFWSYVLARWMAMEGLDGLNACHHLDMPRSLDILLLAGLSCPYPSSPEWEALVAFRGRYCQADSSSLRALLLRFKRLPGAAHLGTEVVGVDGGDHLESIVLANKIGGTRESVPCAGLFCFIGAVPATSWLDGVLLDRSGFILTDTDLPETQPRDSFGLLGRQPLAFETSIPGLFAAGDVRHGSMKRIAAAVGEGSSAIRSVHQAIGK